MPRNVTKYPRLLPTEQHALLQSVVARSAWKAGTATPVIVFDLDGTLMDNRPRTCAILREFAATVGKGPEDAALAAKLMAAKPGTLAYLLTDSLDLLGVHGTEQVARAEQFWRDRFFADDHLRHDIEVPGAVAFARACYDQGATLVYMTGRDLPLMGIGSFRSLRDLGFPIGVPGTELVLKPDAAMPDEAFKRLEGPKLARVGRIVAIFDNEPANCNTLLELNPEADSIFVDTQHLPGAPALHPRVKVIEDFRLA